MVFLLNACELIIFWLFRFDIFALISSWVCQPKLRLQLAIDGAYFSLCLRNRYRIHFFECLYTLLPLKRHCLRDLDASPANNRAVKDLSFC